MAQEIITLDDLQKFRLQLLEDLKDLVSKSDPTPKQWLKSSDVRKMLGILTVRYKIFGSKPWVRSQTIDRKKFNLIAVSGLTKK